MNTKESMNNEVHQNFEFFKTILPELMKTHKGQFALIRNMEIIECFPDFSDAYWFGRKNYSDHLFSIQEVNDQPVILRNIGHVIA